MNDTPLEIFAILSRGSDAHTCAYEASVDDGQQGWAQNRTTLRTRRNSGDRELGDPQTA